MWAVWSAVVAGVVAFFALGFVHWAAPLVAGGRLPRLVCYVLGLGVIGRGFGVVEKYLRVMRDAEWSGFA